MESIFIERTKVSPEIKFDKEENIFLIAGRSLVEDPGKFYSPVYDWVEEYVKNPNEVTDIEFDLEYFNSSSARQIMKIIMLLEDIQENGKKVNLKWMYEEGDDMTKERGEEIDVVSKIDFEIIEYPSEDFEI
ncbi:MAG: DUF1987 domain-containing protein [Bacteroidota bacterium]|nr:DUF1987 domain-containing protein [Bacteroidota bacterium]